MKKTHFQYMKSTKYTSLQDPLTIISRMQKPWKSRVYLICMVYENDLSLPHSSVQFFLGKLWSWVSTFFMIHMSLPERSKMPDNNYYPWLAFYLHTHTHISCIYNIILLLCNAQLQNNYQISMTESNGRNSFWKLPSVLY